MVTVRVPGVEIVRNLFGTAYSGRVIRRLRLGMTPRLLVPVQVSVGTNRNFTDIQNDF